LQCPRGRIGGRPFGQLHFTVLELHDALIHCL
jgi:hypothetical protein